MSENTVIIFGKAAWPYTNEAREAYEAEGKTVDYRDVQANPELLDEMLSHSSGKRQVPVIVEGGKVKIGFGGTWGVWSSDHAGGVAGRFLYRRIEITDWGLW